MPRGARTPTYRYDWSVDRGVLVLLGSGETAPGMTKVHRELLSRHEHPRAVNLDTPYGFQENVPQMTEKLVDYFQTSLQTTLTALSFTNYERAGPVERALFKERVRESNYVFSGPGSPTYALAQWGPLNLAADLREVLSNDGTVVFSSAAVLTLGAFTAPVYEIYKAGAAPYWLEGLNLLKELGLNCVAVPHFDNNEGANYDTRYCYLGERRLQLLQSRLPDNVAVLGVDEHTALVIDASADTLRVLGKSHAYWRQASTTLTLERGSTTPLGSLRHTPVPTSSPASRPTERVSADATPLELAEAVARGGPQAKEAVVRLVRLASEGSKTQRDVTPLVEALLVARAEIRANGNYQLADRLRDALTRAGVEVNDTPNASTSTHP